MIYPQHLLDLHDEMIVDLFAGGGGASCGIEVALGRTVDVAVNHDPAAVALHAANHPATRHHACDVFEVDPRQVSGGRRIGLLWASPDCTHFSKARGGKPVSKRRRSLAWVVVRWAAQVRPRVICMENVEEFRTWGPLVGPREALRPCPRRRGRTFRRWVRRLETLGYTVEHRELRACDYGAPTIRKRLFVVARCDGRPIVWPETTHGPGRARPYRTAAECIDWSIPCPSIFGRARPLADATLRRIARGLVRYVLETPTPFVVANNTNNVPRPVSQPLATVTTGDRLYLAAPSLGTIVGSQKHALVAAFLAQHNAGPRNSAMSGRPANAPLSTVTTTGGQQQLVAATMATVAHGEGREGAVKRWGSGAHDINAPLGTVTTSNNTAVVAAFLATYYGTGDGQVAGEPLRTVTTKDRHAVVTIEVEGVPYAVVDVGMRMLQPRELYRAQGFPENYIIDRGEGGRRLTKTEQVRMVGNSVCPPVAAALVRANVPEMIARADLRRPPVRRARVRHAPEVAAR